MIHKTVYDKSAKLLRQRLIDDDNYRNEYTMLSCDGDKWIRERDPNNRILPMRKKLSDAMDVVELTRLE